MDVKADTTVRFHARTKKWVKELFPLQQVDERTIYIDLSSIRESTVNFDTHPEENAVMISGGLKSDMSRKSQTIKLIDERGFDDLEVNVNNSVARLDFI